MPLHVSIPRLPKRLCLNLFDFELAFVYTYARAAPFCCNLCGVETGCALNVNIVREGSHFPAHGICSPTFLFEEKIACPVVCAQSDHLSEAVKHIGDSRCSHPSGSKRKWDLEKIQS